VLVCATSGDATMTSAHAARRAVAALRRTAEENAVKEIMSRGVLMDGRPKS